MHAALAQATQWCSATAACGCWRARWQQQVVLRQRGPGLALPQSHLRRGCQRVTIIAQQQQQQQTEQGPGSVPSTPTAASPRTAPAASGLPDYHHESELILILIACGIGLATGAAIVVFNDVIHAIRDAIWHNAGGSVAGTLMGQQERRMGFTAEAEIWPKVVFPPLVGGLAVGGLGLLIGGYEDASSSSGGSSSSSGVDKWKARLQAVVRPVSRAVAATVTLGTGASLGPEGPSVDIGRSVAKGLGSTLRSRQQHLYSLLAAGSGAGVAAGFNAPIAGVFFAVETVLQKQQQQQLLRLTAGGVAGAAAVADATAAGTAARQRDVSGGLGIAMVLLASVLAAVVSQAGLGSSPAFRVPAYRLESITELPLYLVFGALCGVVSASFSFSTRVASEAFDELRQQNAVETALLPSIGGLTTGVLALGYPEILYQGFDNVNNILSSNGDYAPGLLVQIVVLKVIATSICRGSGLQGGLYAPSIFIGAALGSAYGQMAHAVFDPTGLLLSAPQAYALVGVAAMLASNCAVPLTAVLLLFELTRDYLIILPTLAAVGISFWVSSLAAPSVKRAASGRRVSSAAAAGLLVGGGSSSPLGPTAGPLGGSGTAGASGTAVARAGGSSSNGSGGEKERERKVGLAAANEAVAAAAAAVVGVAAAKTAASATGSRDVEGGPLVVPGPGPGGRPTQELEAAASAAAAAIAAGLAHPVLLAAAAAAAGQPVVVACAMESSCLVVQADTTMEEALSLMEEADHRVAVVVGPDAAVLGVVSREVLQECVAAAAAAVGGGYGNGAAGANGSSSTKGDGKGSYAASRGKQ